MKTLFLVFLMGCAHEDTGPGPTDPTGPTGLTGPSDAPGPLGTLGGPQLGASCASSSATAELSQANVIVMLDHSLSMNIPSKWPPIADGLKAFYSDAASAGVSASLNIFAGGAGTVAKCNVDSVTEFAMPKVPMSQLPDATQFGTALDALNTGFHNGTPTSAAIRGAAQYADQLAATKKSVIVLATDGEPTTCGNLPEALTAATEVGKKYPMYVIGVGRSLDNLNGLAANGGTKTAFQIDLNNPAQTTSEFRDTLNKIRVQAAACDFAIPTVAGQTIDYNAVNVVITATATSTLGQSADCVNGIGWHYDDANSPSRVVLCPASCDAVKQVSAQVDVLFGCQTAVGPIS